jgi:transcriptional regulator with XRE-family HTH domain
MKDRLLEFLRAENKSSAQLADEIGVQASGISHILSGRNNPSLDFVLKMLEKYQFLSTEWLLFGKGSMYKDPKMQTLFETMPERNSENDIKQIKNEFLNRETGSESSQNNVYKPDESLSYSKTVPEVVKIVWFYDNNSFEEYIPRR